MSAASTLLVIAKAPVPGLAKTRLMARFTADQAADLAAAALLDTLRAARETPASLRVVAMVGDLGLAARGAEISAALSEFTVITQRGATFSERLMAAHLDCFARCAGPVLQIGMDTPQVTVDTLVAAGEELEKPEIDAVLGPADDGGWWAIGLTEPTMASIFPSIAMSRADTGQRTMAALRARGLRVGTLAALHDVDEPDDVPTVAALAPASSLFRAAAHQVLDDR